MLGTSVLRSGCVKTLTKNWSTCVYVKSEMVRLVSRARFYVWKRFSALFLVILAPKKRFHTACASCRLSCWIVFSRPDQIWANAFKAMIGLFAARPRSLRIFPSTQCHEKFAGRLYLQHHYDSAHRNIWSKPHSFAASYPALKLYLSNNDALLMPH